MIKTDEQFIDDVVTSIIKPVTDVTLDVWAEENVRLPFSAISSRFSCTPTPYLREPMRFCTGSAMQNGHRIERVTVVGSVQSAKSTLQEVVASYAIAEEPGPLMWNFQTDGDADEAVRERIDRIFKATPPIAKLLPDRYRAKHIDFGHMFAIIQGAETRANLQSKSIRWLLNDEVWLWPQGHLAEAEKRTTAFWNRFILNTSTGGTEDDDSHGAFSDGDQCEWMFECPACKMLQPYQIKGRNKKYTGGLTWETNELTQNPDGEWNYMELAKTAYYECSNSDCTHRYYDSVASRRDMNLRSRYVAQNTNPLPGNKSFHFNAICVEWVSWSKLVVEFLKAVSASKFGAFLPLQEFIQKRLGEFWKLQETHSEVEKVTANYRAGDPWADEYRLYMSVDVQADHFWYAVRAFATDGRSRLLYCGKILGSWDDVRAVQLKARVADKCVGVDASFGPGGKGPRAVFYQCCRFGWTALMGDDKISYSVARADGKVTQRPISKKMLGDPMRGAKTSDVSAYDKSKMRMRACALFRWSNPTIKKVLDNLWAGNGKAWDIPENTPADWFKQLKAEIPQVKVDPATGRGRVKYVLVDRKNGAHLRDCECMIVAMASLSGLIGDDVEIGGNTEELTAPTGVNIDIEEYESSE